nr:helix-turn-helix transcriptional regulator [Clostridia bacterium]
MERYESFGECLKRCLTTEGLSASEAARLVGFSSRNSIFRILSGEVSDEIKLRFLQKLYEVLGSDWPEKHWHDLEKALSVERLGAARYRENCAFRRLMHEQERAAEDYVVVSCEGKQERPLAAVLEEIAGYARAEIVITGCCDSALAVLLADKCGAAGAKGTLTIRHYIDTAEDVVCQNILGVLPLVSKPWYNARLVATGSCPAAMMAIYRLHAMHAHVWDENGKQFGTMYLQYDEKLFSALEMREGALPSIELLDRWNFHLELLKPLASASDGPEVFVEYTKQYAALEDNCTILSVKPDAHFNCIPAYLLEQAVLEGFEQSGMAAGPELVSLIQALKQVHDQRYHNMFAKRRPTHLVYSLQAMERFMRTGVLSDQFFIQRAYTVEERRAVIRILLDAMKELPYFNVHLLREWAPPLRYEISCFDGKGVLLMDSYTGYDLDRDHSEALITLPAFMEGFKRFFHEELLPHYVRSRSETIQAMERLLVMNVQE